MDGTRMEAVAFSQLQGWEDDKHLEAFEAFLNSAKRMAETPYTTRALGVDGEQLAVIAKVAVDADVVTHADARAFFETHFSPHKIISSDDEAGFITGFFEPLVEASLEKTDHFRYPIYTRPPELIDVDDVNRPPEMDPSYRYGEKTGETIQPYFDRAQITAGALDGRDLELVWLADPVDVFFIHIQGAAKLQLPDGKLCRITYAAKAGHAYTSVAKVLCQQLDIRPEEMTADRLADWLRQNPDERDDLLTHNRSYIFFKMVTGQADNDGPIAAAKVPLVAGRSLAVDRLLHTFGVPIWVETEQPLPDDNIPFQRLMVAHDTGSAIVGPARGDIFTGTGDAAGHVAGRIRHATRMTILLPNSNRQKGVS